MAAEGGVSAVDAVEVEVNFWSAAAATPLWLGTEGVAMKPLKVGITEGDTVLELGERYCCGCSQSGVVATALQIA